MLGPDGFSMQALERSPLPKAVRGSRAVPCARRWALRRRTPINCARSRRAATPPQPGTLVGIVLGFDCLCVSPMKSTAGETPQLPSGAQRYLVNFHIARHERPEVVVYGSARPDVGKEFVAKRISLA